VLERKANVGMVRTVAFDARYVNDRYHGIGRHAYNVFEALTRLDPGRRYIAYYHPGYDNTRFDMADLRQRANVEIRPLRIPLYLPSEHVIWPAVLSRARADLFHSPYVVLPFAARVPAVITVHDLILERHPEYRPRGSLQKLYGPLTRLSTARANLVLTVTNATSRDIQQYYGVDGARLHVIGNGVDRIFRPEENPARLALVRERYKLPNRFILAVGAARPQKSLETLVDAFAYLDPSVAPALVIAGEVDARFADGVRDRVDTHGIAGRVVRPGFIDEADLPALYTLAEVLAFPSVAEGFGLPPLEAMACGTPVVAASSSAVSEVVGDAALTFEPGDARELATRLASAVTDPDLRAALTRRGLKRADAFTWERVAAATLQAYALVEARATGTCLARRTIRDPRCSARPPHCRDRVPR
jgi:glycosyltransferase involved in cell wall biosynthesis